jgi:peptidoglycan hydrolase FlgJ
MIRIDASAATPSPAKPEPALHKAAQAFEAVFLRQIIGTMRAAKLADPMFGSNAADQFRELADKNTADAMATRGAFGIAAMIEKQLTAKTGDAQ